MLLSSVPSKQHSARDTCALITVQTPDRDACSTAQLNASTAALFPATSHTGHNKALSLFGLFSLQQPNYPDALQMPSQGPDTRCFSSGPFPSKGVSTAGLTHSLLETRRTGQRTRQHRGLLVGLMASSHIRSVHSKGCRDLSACSFSPAH